MDPNHLDECDKTRISQAKTQETSFSEDRDCYVGTTIDDRYEVLSVVGKGGMGAVYKVRHKQLQTILAMKVLRRAKDIEAADIARFDAEARAAGRLRHANLSGIYDYGITSGGMPFFVMDFIEGEPLSQYLIRQGRLTENLALPIFLQICDGLQYAHSKGIVHRDIKPGNIMLFEESGKQKARLVDFGIAKELAADKPALTQTGELIGSPLYMSPEQCQGGQIDVRSDIYSFGCTMFEALTGIAPFNADSSTQVLVKHINERAPLFNSVAPQFKFNSALERVVMQTLEKQPDDRYQSIGDLRRDLELIYCGKNPVKEVSRLRNRVRAVAAISRWLLIAAAVSSTTLAAAYLIGKASQPTWAKIEQQARQQMAGGPQNYNDAEVTFKEAVKSAIDGRAPQNDQERLLIELGRVQSYMHKPQQALKTLAEAQAVSATHAEDRQRGWILDQLAEVYRSDRQLDKAEKFAREALEVKTRQFGEINAYTARSMFNLCAILQQEHKYAQAEPLSRKLVIVESKLSTYIDNMELADAYRHLARILYRQNKVEEAIDPAHTALHLYLRLEGADDPSTQRLAQWLLEMLKSAHRDSEAAEVAHESGL